VTGLCHNETGFPTNEPKELEANVIRLTEKITKHAEEIIKYETQKLEDADVVIFAYGSVARSARRAVTICREQGIKAGLFEPTVLWPFPTAPLSDIARSVKAFVVPELNLGQMAREVELAAACRVPVHRVSRVDGEPIPPGQIVARVKEVV
jgi:2-oxoglutarate ferredoxin oxidoreductase subunit alpha